MKHILLPTDFSDNSEQAVPFAAEMAHLFDADLTLFNSYKLPYSKSNLLVSITDRMKSDSESGLKVLRDKILANPRYKDLRIRLESRTGTFVPLIPKIADDCNTNLIVMGTKGASGIKEIFIGSNTLEVINTTRCPVLAIPEDAEVVQFNKIAMATDLRKVPNEAQLDPLFKVARKCGSHIEFVHVNRDTGQALSQEQKKQLDNLMKMAHGVEVSTTIVENKDIIDGLSEYVNANDPDLIAMLTRRHSLFEQIFQKSITNKLAFRTEIPLLVMDE
jgi:nucleotide-binding universal stress UspA family protein